MITRLFKDTFTGTRTAGRTQFLEMVNYLSSDVPEAGIVIWEYARLSRDYDDFMFYIADWRRRGYQVISITDQVPEGLEGRLLEAVTAWKNASLSRDMAKNVKRGLSYVVNIHHAVLGTAPVGYKRVPVEIGKRRDGTPHIISRLEPDDRTAQLVQRAFAMRAAGATTAQINNAVHIHDRPSAYYRMFHNPVYIGVRGAIQDYCPPLIDLATWEAVQAVNRERATNYGYNHPRAVRSRFFLTGLLKCGVCGRPMNGLVLKRKPYADRLYYRCIDCIRAERSCHASVIPKALLEQAVITVIRERILVPELLEDLYQRARSIVASGDADRQASIQRAQGRWLRIQGLWGALWLLFRPQGILQPFSHPWRRWRKRGESCKANWRSCNPNRRACCRTGTCARWLR